MNEKCIKCGKIIPIGEVCTRTENGVKCEKCSGIRNPYDNPEDYKYYWNGRFCKLEELPSFAHQLFPNLRCRK
jgi:NAD-dependent SIR2 family protein deacetylase